jgi:hypothetical protein
MEPELDASSGALSPLRARDLLDELLQDALAARDDDEPMLLSPRGGTDLTRPTSYSPAEPGHAPELHLLSRPPAAEPTLKTTAKANDASALTPPTPAPGFFHPLRVVVVGRTEELLRAMDASALPLLCGVPEGGAFELLGGAVADCHCVCAFFAQDDAGDVGRMQTSLLATVAGLTTEGPDTPVVVVGVSAGPLGAFLPSNWCEANHFAGPLCCALAQRGDVVQLLSRVSGLLRLGGRGPIPLVDGVRATLPQTGDVLKVTHLLPGGAISVTPLDGRGPSVCLLSEVEIKSDHVVTATTASSGGSGLLEFAAGDSIQVLCKGGSTEGWIGVRGHAVGIFQPPVITAPSSVSSQPRAASQNVAAKLQRPVVESKLKVHLSGPVTDSVTPLLHTAAREATADGTALKLYSLDPREDANDLNSLVVSMMATTGGLERREKKKAKNKKLKKPVLQCWEGVEAVTWVAARCDCSRAEVRFGLSPACVCLASCMRRCAGLGPVLCVGLSSGLGFMYFFLPCFLPCWMAVWKVG